MSESETLTGATGQFAFTGLRAGNYTIEISGFDNEDVGFGSTSSAAQVAIGESRVVSFEGTYLRASAIIGQVSVEGSGLEGVTVSLQGKGETREMMTNGAGQFMFEELRRGDYAIGISGYDDDEYGFETTSKSVMVPYGETENVPFEGTALRTAEVRGMVTVEGMGPLDGVTVSLSGKGDDPDPVVTLGDGQFSFERLHAGDYQISIFGFDTDEYGFDVTSENVTVALKETATVEFGGIMLRTAAIEGAVTINGDALPGVTVTVTGGPKDEEHTATTNIAGMYEVDELHAGDYSVAISGFDTDEYGFDVTSDTVTVALEETATVEFGGIMLRTAEVRGMVTVEGMGPLPGVTVSLSGKGDDPDPVVTLGDGQFSFERLHAGDYTISIFGFDTDEYGFDVTSENVTVALEETATVEFDGIMLRTAGIEGAVTINGGALPDVTVTVSGGPKDEEHTATTNTAGMYEVDELHAGDYSVAISGFDTDEYGFDVTSENVTVALEETATVEFGGIMLRTAGIEVAVTIKGVALPGVTVTVSGGPKDEEHTATTDTAGMYEVDELYAGDYSVAISGFDTDVYGFDGTSENVKVALEETATVEFDGIMLRTAGIEGAVTVKGVALPGVTVTVSGGPKDEEHTATTNTAGMYEVDELHAGDYSVAISGFDTDEYGFDVTSKNVTVALEKTATVEFDGIMLRTAGVSGRVTVDGEAERGLTVTLSGEEDRTVMTNADGQYAFSGLAAGDYMLALSGYDAAEYEFEAGMDVTLELDEAAIANFMGRSLRTVVVMGTVSAEGDALAGVAVTLIKILGASSGEVLGAMMTDTAGGYMFDKLLAGTYRIDLGDTDAEYHFATKTRLGAVATDSTAMWDFDATIIRTASVSGMVTVDGDGMADIKVMLTGDYGTDMDTATVSDGGYMFDGLRKGSYTVAIENPDADMYDFPTISRSVGLAVGQAQADVSFAGSMLRRASISGQVHVEGAGLEGVMVTLDGDADAEEMTDGNGEYNFPGLAGGDYDVTMENPDTAAYTFDVTKVEVDDLGDEVAQIVDFAGEHTTTASVSGMMFLDEIVKDSVRTADEPDFEATIPLFLRGPGLGEVIEGTSDSTGMYSFEGLKAGTYQVLVARSDSLNKVLAKAGYMFIGRLTGQVVNVPAATDVNVNFPFRITEQTIYGGALLANTKSASFAVGGVSMTLYPTAEDAEDGTNSLDAATTRSGKIDDPNTGFAKFDFDRAKDKGPGGGDIDYLVYAKVTRVSHSDLVVHDDGIIEIEYEPVDRVSHAPAAVKLINTRVNFQWWVKSNEDAKDGNQFLGGWVAKNGKTVLDTTDADGMGRYSGKVSAAQMASLIKGTPLRFTVALDTVQADSVDMNERWVQSRSVSHAHTGLEHPDSNTAKANDLGPIYVTWRTHSMVLGIYRETDDVAGFTDYQSKVPGGDHRPVSAVADSMKITLLARDSRNRLVTYKYDHDVCTNKNHRKTKDQAAPKVRIKDGLATVSCLPAGDEFTIRFELGDDRVMVGVAADELRGDIEAFNQSDLTVGGTVLGTFGDGSGGVPEVRICLASEGTTDDECATWGYQWMTGTILGEVRYQSGHKITIAPTTENHGAEVDTTYSRTEGAYKLEDLRDGVYDITAHNTRRYKVLDDTTQMVYVYHDETTDDKDTITKYVGTAAVDTATWRTRQLGLKIMGYIGNDVNRDSKFRGDESVAGITVRLTGSGGVSLSTTTNERGFYKFDNLEKTSYRITPSTNTYVVNYGYSTFGSRKTPKTSHSATAWEYPYATLPEGDFRLPYWSSYTSRSLSNFTSKVCNEATPPKCGTLYNFGLLYKDGEAEGGVNNLSGSSSGIDLVWTDVFLDRESEVTTNSSGEFSRKSLVEGDYSAVIEDVGWAMPCMSSRSSTAKPDDDAVDADGDCRFPAPTTITANVSGKDDFASMGMLHVYDEGASSDDAASSSVRVRGRDHGRVDYADTAASWRTGWSRDRGSKETENTTSIGTITWASESVSLYFGSALSKGAKAEVKKGSTVCASHRCELDDNPTGSPRAGDDKENTLTVTVTAENGYDDHEYSLVVRRAAPVGFQLDAAGVIALKSDGTDSIAHARGGLGTTVGGAWTLPTRSSNSSSATLRIDLETLGSLKEKNAVCAQSVVVTEYNDTTKIKALNPDDDDDDSYEDDICRNTRYRLSAALDGKLYELTVTSQDDKDEVYYLEVSRAGPTLSDDATLSSLVVDPGNLSPAFDSATTEYEVGVTHNTEEVTVTWKANDDSATSVVSPADADADTDGHQLALGAEGTETKLTITVTAENEDTKTYTITVNRPVEPVTDDATLASLTVSDGTLTPEFDAEVTEYTASAKHNTEQITVTWDEAHENATSEATPADADADTDGHQLDLGIKGTTTALTITVTAADETTKEEYTVTVTRLLSDDATLASLNVDPGILNPSFSPADTMYTVQAAYDVEQVTVTWKVNDDSATAVANIGDADDDTDGYQLKLKPEGDTTEIKITVTAENGDTTKAYTIAVNRAEGPPNDDATLKDLLVDGTSVPGFRPDARTYLVKVAFNVDTVSVTWVTADEDATTDPVDTIVYKLGLKAAGSDTKLTITVTAEDEDTTLEYVLTVSRAAAPGIVLSVDSTMTVTEGSDSNTYTVKLATRPTQQITVAVTTVDGLTIRPGFDNLVFDTLNYDSARVVAFDAGGDVNAEQEEPLTITHAVTSTGDPVYDTVSVELAVTVTETDIKGVTVSAAGIEFTEGENNTYTVVLNSQPKSNVVLSMFGAPSGVTLNEDEDETLLTFTTDTWNSTQNVIIASADNADTAAHAGFTLNHQAIGGGYGGVQVDDVDVKIMDDESPAVVISRTEATILETGTLVYNIQLTQEPDNGESVTVRLEYFSGDFSVSYDGGGASAVLTPDNYNAGIDVTVTPVAVNRDKTRRLTHTVSSAGGEDEGANDDDLPYSGPIYRGATASSVTITVKNVPDPS